MDWKWVREPGKYLIEPDRIEITTMPHTDLWQRTYYHFRNDNAPVLQTETEEKFFSFIVKTDFAESHKRFDQCGIVKDARKDMTDKRTTRLIAQSAVIAAIYVVLTIVFAPIAFEEIQVRIAEALTILPIYTASAVPGLAVGCLLGNIIGGAPLPDVVFGSLATLIGAVGTRLLRNSKLAIAVIPPIAANMVIIPFVLRYAYEIPLPIPLMMVTVGLGEVISCGMLGLLRYKALLPHRDSVFKV